MGQRHSRLQPGDLIEIDRGHHQHWALYLGDGYVINVRPRGKGIAVWQDAEGSRKVQKQLLKEVVKKDEWRVNNDSDQDHTPLPAEEIIRRAEWWINKVVLYGVLGRKCERFVKKLRYGDQVRHLLAARCSPRGWDTYNFLCKFTFCPCFSLPPIKK
uniref:LRAT domain-containing protein n=1 Tax=Malurus cyaneus samueli TaxID=2593467 RepID=A0A8C5U1E8_9PASS